MNSTGDVNVKHLDLVHVKDMTLKQDYVLEFPMVSLVPLKFLIEGLLY